MTDLFDEMIARADAEAEAVAAGAPRTPICGCRPVSSREDVITETIPYGEDGGTFQVDVPVVTCLTCGSRFTDERAETLCANAARAIGLRLVGDA